MNRFLGAFVASLIAAAPVVAFAQNVDTDAVSSFARDRNVSVRQRPHPEYDVQPHHLGAFVVKPTVTVEGEYNDNIYATNVAKADDFIAHIQPRVDVQSTWSRNSLSAYAETTFNQYARFKTENTTDWVTGAAGRLDILRFSNITLGGDAGRFTESRTSTSTQVESLTPIHYYLNDGYLAGVYEVNRIRLSVRGDIQDYNYQDGRAADGSSVLEDDRDRVAKSVLGRVDYAVSPATAIFFQVAGNWRDYRLNPPTPGITINRDFSGYELLGGANFELTNLIRGELGVGYLSQTYRQSTFGPLNGVGARGKLEWFPTQLTTVTGTVSRTVQDSGIPNSAGYLSTSAGVQIDHELLRNVILTAIGNYGDDNYRDIDRQDHRWTLGASATYQVNRRLGVILGYNFFNQTSSGLARGFDFSVNQVTLSLVGHL